MIPIEDLNFYNPIVLISIPDILMNESGSSSISIILNKAYKIVDFPAPVLPTQPTFMP